MKTEFPPVDFAPKKRLDLRAIKAPEGEDANVEANSRKLAAEWGAVTTVTPPRAPIASLRIEIPEYLDRELAQRAFEQRATKQFLVVQALKAAGFHVEDADLVPDKRKRR
ncbi:MAG: hypothetical protein INR62_04400 [Rhodospirillales bacterium]|nr:hypothetical protein [Acetobacter sp.]